MDLNFVNVSFLQEDGNAGKNFIFKDTDKISDDLICPICLSPAEDARAHMGENCCERIFCSNCIGKCKSCPMCRLPIDNPRSLPVPMRIVRKQLDELKVLCIYCSEQTTRSEILNHTSKCPVLQVRREHKTNYEKELEQRKQKLEEELESKKKEAQEIIDQREAQSTALIKQTEQELNERKEKLLEDLEVLRKQAEVEIADQMKQFQLDRKAIEDQKQFFEQMRKKNSRIINLNVSGQLFTTSLDTITSQESSALNGLFNSDSPDCLKDKDGNIFLDADPKLFSIILSWLRTGYLPNNMPIEQAQQLHNEAKYLGLSKLEQLCEQHINSNHNSNKDVISLNVRGTVIQTRKKLLTSQPSKLADIINDTPANEEIFLDVDPLSLNLLLDWLQTGRIPCSPLQRNQLSIVASHFHFADLAKSCELEVLNPTLFQSLIAARQRGEVLYLGKCDFRNLALRGFFLTDTYLASSEFSGMDLSDISLERANLCAANLSGANLSGANLRESNLSNINLSGANLFKAYLSNINLSDAKLSDANLSRANLSYANLSRANLSGANLSNVDLSFANLSDANLSYANLSEVGLARANLKNADLTGTKLNGANIQKN